MLSATSTAPSSTAQEIANTAKRRGNCRLSTVLSLITLLDLAGALVRTQGGRVRRAE